MKKYRIVEYKMVDGRTCLREQDIETGEMRLVNLPKTSDYDFPANSLKYAGKTFGQIAEIDKDYLLWVVKESKAPSRQKKIAARLYLGIPYRAKEVGEIINEEELYNPLIGKLI
jgi:hypothetical protein